MSLLALACSLPVAVIGAYYLVYAGSVAWMGGFEGRRINTVRARLRRANAVVMLLMGLALYLGIARVFGRVPRYERGRNGHRWPSARPKDRSRWALLFWGGSTLGRSAYGDFANVSLSEMAMKLSYLLPVVATICASAALLVSASVSHAMLYPPVHSGFPCPTGPNGCPADDERSSDTWCEGQGANRLCFPIE